MDQFLPESEVLILKRDLNFFWHPSDPREPFIEVLRAPLSSCTVNYPLKWFDLSEHAQEEFKQTNQCEMKEVSVDLHL